MGWGREFKVCEMTGVFFFKGFIDFGESQKMRVVFYVRQIE